MSGASDSANQSITRHDIGEALYHGEARCDGCGETVDLSDAENVEEAGEIWNNHVRSVHGEDEYRWECARCGETGTEGVPACPECGSRELGHAE